MSLEFVIVPINKHFEMDAKDMLSKIQNTYKNGDLIIEIDTNYNLTFASRVNKLIVLEKDIIVINSEYKEYNKIAIRFSDKHSKLETMEISDFLEIIHSFECQDEKEENEEEYTNETCIII
jgi:hypothetical protein